MKNIERIEPGEGQESVWDYPRPPRIEDSSKQIKVMLDNIIIAESTRSKRILETSHPPVYYIPREDINLDCLKLTTEVSYCEFKGKAHYFDFESGDTLVKDVAWTYQAPSKLFAEIKNYLAFYAFRVECYVDDERVEPQPGEFYGGWVTKDIVGPFKGGPGTWGW